MLGIPVRSDLAQGMITIASTSFVILFGVISTYPVMMKFFVIRTHDIDKRVELNKRFEYRFLKRLYKGRTLLILLMSAILFLLSNLTSLYYLHSGKQVVLTINTILVAVPIFFVIAVVIISLIQAIGPPSKGWNLVIEFGESSGGIYPGGDTTRDDDTATGDDDTTTKDDDTAAENDDTAAKNDDTATGDKNSG